MRIPHVVSIVAMLCLLPDRLPAQQSQQAEPPPLLPEVSAEIVEQTNVLRTENRLDPVSTQPELQNAARYFAQFMASSDEYGHQADGQEPWDRAEQYGYDYCIVEENIAWQSGVGKARLAERFVSGWANSPGHRRNMLDADVSETGVAVAYSVASGKFYAVQLFGRPRSAAIEFSIANRSRVALQYELLGQEFELPPLLSRRHTVCSRPELRLSTLDEKDAQRGSSRQLEPSDGTQIVIRSVRNGVIELSSDES